MPDRSMPRNIKDSFELASDHYGYRLPYPKALFHEVSRYLKFDERTSILDLCCGQGQLSLGFADRIGRAVATDFSEQMIASAPRHERVDYVLHDVNAPDPLPDRYRGSSFSHIVIGRAVHWIGQPSLDLLAARNLEREGRILICGSGFTQENPWQPALTALRKSYEKGEPKRDFIGTEKLADAGFLYECEAYTEFKATASVDFMTRYALSFGRSTERISDDLDSFRVKLKDLLAPYMTGNRLIGDAMGWALIFRRR